MRRVGTNFTDRNNIKEYVDAGVTDAQRIGRNLNVEPRAVQGYIDSLTEPVEAEPEPAVAAAPEPEEAKPRRRKKAEEVI